MAEDGVAIFASRSIYVRELMHIDFDYGVTVCGGAHESSLYFPGKSKVLHVGFDDPPRPAKNAPNEEKVLTHYRGCERRSST